MKHVLFPALFALALAATPALADPWVPVDASPTRIVFLDKASTKTGAGAAEATILWMVIADDGSTLMVESGEKMKCADHSMVTGWTAIVADDGSIGASTPTSDTDYKPATAGTIGYAIVETACTGVSPNASAAGISDPRITDAIARGKAYLASQTPSTPSTGL